MIRNRYLLLISFSFAVLHLIISVFFPRICTINAGVAFSFFEYFPFWATFLPVICLASIIALSIFTKRYVLLSLVPPAVSNLLDRLMHGGVCDYIYVKGFTIFNVNDIVITSIVIISIIYLGYEIKDRKKRG